MSPRSHASAGATSYVAVALVVVVTAVAAIGVLELAPVSSPNIPATSRSRSVAGPPSSAQNTTATSSVSTSSDNGHPPDYCGSAVFPVRGQQETGSIFLKIVTDQGSIVTNGSVLVVHSIAGGPQVSINRTTYCLNLEPNATGFIELENDGLPQNGVYNLTFSAGYDQGPGTLASVYLFSVQPNTSVYVTVSVPSREVQVVTSTAGGSVVTSTTTAVPQ